MMRTPAVALDIEECFHANVRKLVVITVQERGKDSVRITTGLSKIHFHQTSKNTPSFVIGTDAKPAFLRR